MGNPNKFFESIRRTAEDLTTLEINTIIKDDMSCVKPTDNNRLALYQLAKRYNLQLDELGEKYYKVLIHDDMRQEFEDSHRFQKGYFRGGGIFTFRELSILARLAIDWINENHEYFSNDTEDRKKDRLALQRVELKSEEIRIMLEDNYQTAKGNPFMDKMREHFLKLKSQNLPSLERNRLIYDQMAETDLYGFREETKEAFMGSTYNASTKCIDDLDLRDKMLVRKALDLGTERVVMQTRISMDGDITTRLAEQFAQNPKQFVMDMHQASINMAVSYWQTLFDALVSYGSKILDKLP